MWGAGEKGGRGGGCDKTFAIFELMKVRFAGAGTFILSAGDKDKL